MIYTDFSELEQKVLGLKQKTIVVAAAHDEHAMKAILSACNQGIVDYILVGQAAKIKAIGEKLGKRISDDVIVNTEGDAAAAAKAVTLIREKRGDFLMKGALETSTLLRAVLNKEQGLRNNSTMSHVAILKVPAYHKLIALTDGGMIPHPTLGQKVLIMKNALAVLRSMGYEKPKIAVLAASETVNERMPETADAQALCEMAREGTFGVCELDGPISLDLSISAESCRIKNYSSPVAADADILVVPDIASGNLLSKSMIYFGNAKMAGCIVGASVPIVLTSRGASAEEKNRSILLCAAIAPDQ